MTKISVACMLPSGLTIAHGGVSTTLLGSGHDKAIAGFGITHDVDEAYFEAWKKDMGPDFPPLKNGLIFATTKAKIEDEATERAETVNGFEGLNPDKPAPGVEPTDGQKRETAKAQAAAAK